jgi:hypothetical protein
MQRSSSESRELGKRWLRSKYRGKHYTFQNRAGRPARTSLDPLPAGAESEVEQMHNYISRIGTNVGAQDLYEIYSYGITAMMA